MKTDQLIAALAADTAPRAAPATRLPMALSAGLLVSALAVVFVWHTRPDLAQALASPALAKTVLPAVLAVPALWLARRITRPEARLRAEWAVVGAVLLAALAAIGWNLVQSGPGAMVAALSTPNLITCLVSVPVLSTLPLAGTLWAMRDGAPANPLRAGAVAGLVSGAAATALYSLHCPEDSLLFFLPAYGFAILMVVGAGALIGRRLLRW